MPSLSPNEIATLIATGVVFIVTDFLTGFLRAAGTSAWNCFQEWLTKKKGPP